MKSVYITLLCHPFSPLSKELLNIFGVGLRKGASSRILGAKAMGG
jgi:hypothetical protein